MIGGQEAKDQQSLSRQFLRVNFRSLEVVPEDARPPYRAVDVRATQQTLFGPESRLPLIASWAPISVSRGVQLASDGDEAVG